MQYNIARNGSLTSPTSVSGIGTPNRVLSYSELQSLTNNNLTSSGITMSSSESVFIQVDLEERIKIEDVKLYCNNTTSSGLAGINIYWKNDSTSSYQGATEDLSTDYYYATIPEPSAPRFILVTISGIDISVFELGVYNDDYIIAFGTDGTQDAEYIEDAPIGVLGEVQILEIFNNSTSNMPATAYVSIDYTGNTADYYLEISNSPDGPFYDLTDGIILQNNTVTNDYTWDMGTYWNTYVTSNRIQVPSITKVFKSYGNVPLTNRTCAWRAGQNCWDYDPATRTIYAIGAELSTALKLYKRSIDSGSWSFIGNVNTGVTGFQDYATMTYMNGRVYVICNLTGTFGYYTVSGTQHNWTSLTSVGFPNSGKHRIGICSDHTRYIYALGYQWDWSIGEFRRYDTTTSGWSSMASMTNVSYSNDAAYASRCCLAYDYDRNMIYADIAGFNYDGYIRRYNVALNSWENGWFSVDSYTNNTGDSNAFQTHTYYGGYLILASAQTGTRLYYYNIDTGSITYTEMEYGFYVDPDIYAVTSPSVNPYILATDLPANLGTSLGDDIEAPLGIGIFGAQLSNDRTIVYGLGLETNDAGYYVTPVFALDDPYMSSYVVIDGSGNININLTDVDTIQVRSSDTEPIAYYESISTYSPNSSDTYSVRWSVYNNSYTTTMIYDTNSNYIPFSAAVDPKDGRYAINIGESAYSRGWLYLLDNSNTLLYSIYSDTDYKYYFNIGFQFEGSHGLWAYGNYSNAASKVLYHFDTDLSELASYSESQLDFIYELATEYNGRGCWYTNQIDNTLVHMNPWCSKLKTIALDKPRCIVQTLDGGVWVEEDTLDVVYRYDFNGNRIDTFTIPITPAYNDAAISRMSTDLNNGFWYRHGDYVFHVTENKVVDVGPVFVLDPDRLQGTKFGCFVYSTDDNIMYWVGMNGTVTSRAMPSSGEAALFGCYGITLEDFSTFKTTCLANSITLPRSYDPVWGSSGSLGWTTVPKTGYLLSKKKYHQIRVYLRGTSSRLNKILIPPAVKIEDIPAGSFKNLYLRTNIPESTNITDYQSGIKVWWDVEDN